jgi:hypothetical protein
MIKQQTGRPSKWNNNDQMTYVCLLYDGRRSRVCTYDREKGN